MDFKDTLINIYGFDESKVDQAIHDIGNEASSIEILVDYLVEKLKVEDKGGGVNFVRCNHLDLVNTLIKPNDIKQNTFKTPSCKDCKLQNETWLCLHCLDKRCSKYGNQHSLKHYKDSMASDEQKVTIGSLANSAENTVAPLGHHIAISLSDLSTWCYACNKYVFHESLDNITKRLESIKFRDENLNDAIKNFNEPNLVENYETKMTAIEAHGFHAASMYKKKPLALPKIIVFSEREARPGYNSKSASEFEDLPDVLDAKIDLLIKLLKKSKHCIVYSGAGLSTACGISDYASGGNTINGKKHVQVHPTRARPSISHLVLKELYKQKMIHKFVNQNHDSILIKAGIEVSAVNEIHGSWFEPTNPVVPMSGTLRGDLVRDLYKQIDATDLVLSLGTSLCGMNADGLVREANKRMNMGKKNQFGSIIIGLQQTVHDDKCGLRIFSKLDHVFEIIAKKLNIEIPKDDPKLYELGNMEEVFENLPYDPKTGKYSKKNKITIDLRKGKKVRLVNIPDWDLLRLGGNDIAISEGRSKDGHFILKIYKQGSKVIFSTRILGSWWLTQIVDQLPIVQI